MNSINKLQTNNLNNSKTPETIKLIQKFHLINYIQIIFQLINMVIFFIYLLKVDIYEVIKSSIEVILKEEDKANKDVNGILIFCLKFGTYFSFPGFLFGIIVRLVYNYRYIKFFDGSVIWLNNFLFYIFYSMVTPILCSMVEDKNSESYMYFIYAEIYTSFIMGFTVIIIALILVFFCFINTVGGTTEVGRSYVGHTEIIYYEYNDSHDFGCGNSCIAKIIKFSYKLLTIVGIIFPILILVLLNNYFSKIFVILEIISNIFVFISIKNIQNQLKKNTKK
jgi:hypothetical protein